MALALVATLVAAAQTAAAQDAAAVPADERAPEPVGEEATVAQGPDASAGEPSAPESVRQLSADRPDVTESPYSVPQGHFQLEMDLLVREQERDEATWAFAVANLKLGLLDFLDLQLVLRPLVAPPSPDGADRSLGYDDITLRIKANILGNDEGSIGLGVLGWVTIPLPGSVGGAWEAGLAIPFGADLPWELSLGAMVEADLVQDPVAQELHAELLGTLTLGRPIFGPLSAFVEGALRVSIEAGTPILATVNGGLLFEVNENLVFDAGVYVGLTDEAPDVVAFAGVTARI